MLFEEVSLLPKFLNKVFFVEELVLKLRHFVLVDELVLSSIGRELGGAAPAIVLLQVLPIEEELELADGNFRDLLKRAAILADFREYRCVLRLARLREESLQNHALHLDGCLECLSKACITRVKS